MTVTNTLLSATIIMFLSIPPLALSNNGYGGNSGPYNPYNPYPYPCQCPYPSTQKPTPDPLSPTNIVAFAFTRARKNNQCLNVHMCFLQFDNEVTKFNAITYPRYGAFQATIPGLYYFTFSLALGGAVTPRVSLRKNNDIISAVNGTSIPNATSNHFPVTSSILLQLQPQDAVYLVVEDGDVVESNSLLQGPLNSFSGYLITPILPANFTSTGTSNQPGGGIPGAPGAPGTAGFPATNLGFTGGNPGTQNRFNLLNPSSNRFPTNIIGMPPMFGNGRGDIDTDFEASEK